MYLPALFVKFQSEGWEVCESYGVRSSISLLLMKQHSFICSLIFEFSSVDYLFITYEHSSIVALCFCLCNCMCFIISQLNIFSCHFYVTFLQLLICLFILFLCNLTYKITLWKFKCLFSLWLPSFLEIGSNCFPSS